MGNLVMLKRQRGLSMSVLILVLLVVAFFATAAVKLAPKYVESMTAKSIVERIASESKGKSKNDIRDAIRKSFSISLVKSVDTKKITFEAIDGGYRINSNYEVRVPFMYNIDVVLKFDDLIYDTP